MRIEEIMRLAPVIPVLTIDEAATAVPLAQALVRGGLRALEITLRTPQSREAIRAVRDQVKEAVVGAGTVLTVDDLHASRDAGAQFAVAPGSTLELLKAAKEASIPFLPGIASATELMLGLAQGYRAFKFFPAENLGGAAMVKALSAPFAQILFCPTGGITLQSAKDYLQLSAVPCVGGSWVAPRDAIATHDWPRIEGLAAEACRALEL
jgi:2-dehydro-3-deoxyphosphogluconate aldolase / (4S)-4-hydroxy-2-oxoglutarate aldolase